MKKNVLEELEKLLKNEEKYVSEDNKILKAKVYEDVVTMNENLLEILLSNETLKNIFFKEVKGVLVFDKQQFIWYLESKEFLPDSYTRYTNKIGLISREEYISKRNEVVLDFPYKDCYLVGGQEKDEEKREEIFLNEVIAGEEVKRMLSPKVLTKAKRYLVGGGMKKALLLKKKII